MDPLLWNQLVASMKEANQEPSRPYIVDSELNRARWVGREGFIAKDHLEYVPYSPYQIGECDGMPVFLYPISEIN